MRLDRPFLKLPVLFDAETLEAEVRALPPSAWVPHATGFPGNEAVRLVTVGGQPTDGFEGAMRPTPNLAACPYMQQVMAELGGVWGRSRLMGLGIGAEVPEHVDAHYHWRTHVRIHVPVITNPQVEFTCGGETIHMAPGECWLFDSFRWHEVHNRGHERRVHLVLDTVVTPNLWDLIEAAQGGATAANMLRPGERLAEPLLFEQVNAPKVMSPWEVRCHLAFITGEAEPHAGLERVLKRLDRFADSWAGLWARFGTDDEGFADYRRLIGEIRAELEQLGAKDIRLRNELELPFVLEQLIFTMAVPDRPSAIKARRAPVNEPTARTNDAVTESKFDRPILIVSPPRSGSTLLFETLEKAPGLYSIGSESHMIIESLPGFHPADRQWQSNRLTAEDARTESARQFEEHFYGDLRDREDRPAAGTVRILEKTPKNSLRIPFFDALWPDALFVYLYRDVRETLASMMEAWASGHFRTYQRLPGWTGYPWSLLLVPGWQRLRGQPLPFVVAHQWSIATNTILDDLGALPEHRIRSIRQADFLAEPEARISALARSLGLDWDRSLAESLPLSKSTVSQPRPDKWRRLEREIEEVFPIVAETDERARAFVAQYEGWFPLAPRSQMTISAQSNK